LKTKKTIAGFGAQAVGWRFAAGSSAVLSLLVQALFNAGIALVSLACVLAVVNILLIAVFRRTREIGTLRAIGARDTYIRLLILSENASLGVFAGIFGIAAGALLLNFINSLHIEISNDILASVLGGHVIHIEWERSLAIVTFGISMLLSLISSVYPVEMAVKIDPVVAVQSG
jgi:putative ABC transport system permease protein